MRNNPQQSYVNVGGHSVSRDRGLMNGLGAAEHSGGVAAEVLADTTALRRRTLQSESDGIGTSCFLGLTNHAALMMTYVQF
jgi:hypothetical protein